VSIDSILTSVIVAAEAAVFLPILYRKIWRTLPIFCAYLLWALLSDIAGLILQMHSTAAVYLEFYRGEMIADSTLMFVVLVELCWSVLRPVRASLPKGAIFVLAALIAIAGLLIWPLAGKALPTDAMPLSLTIFRLQATFSILRVACFLVMAGFSQLLSINWRDRELQVATGLGVFALVSLTVSILHSHQTVHSAVYHRMDEIISISYLGTLAYWVLSFAGKEYQRKEFSPQMQQFLVYMGGTTKAGSLALTKMPPNGSRTRDK